MSPEAVELDLAIHNDYQLWKQHEAIEAMLAKKIYKGIYNPDLAVKGWMNLVDRAARMYAKDNSMPSRAFDRSMRREVATELERRFYRKHMGMRKNVRGGGIIEAHRDEHTFAGKCLLCGERYVNEKRHFAEYHPDSD